MRRSVWEQRLASSRAGTPRSPWCLRRPELHGGPVRGAEILPRGRLGDPSGWLPKRPTDPQRATRICASVLTMLGMALLNSLRPAEIPRVTRGISAEDSEVEERQPNLDSTVFLPGQVWLLFSHPSAGLSGRACRGTPFRPRCKRPGVVPRHPTTQPQAQLGLWLSGSS